MTRGRFRWRVYLDERPLEIYGVRLSSFKTPGVHVIDE
jgi:hypothetical protein